MGIFDRVVKNAVNNAVGNAVGRAVEKAVAPKIEQAAAGAVNHAADKVNQAVAYNTPPPPPVQQSTMNQESVNQAANTLGGLFGSLQGAATSFANEAAKNMKICPVCGEGASAETKFCPSCGATMPEQTVAQGAVCSSCGKQNDIGVKFCSDCGAKLPAAVAEEQAALAKDAATLVQWETILPQYPKWCFGGHDISLEYGGTNDNGTPYYFFHVLGVGDSEVQQYRALIKQNGFVQAGEYPSDAMLYKMIGGSCYYFESAEPFASEYMGVSFGIGEPSGGFYYTKPEKKNAGGSLFRGLFK